MTAELVSLGILEPDSQAALVRTWGRSYARLAEWQAELLGGPRARRTTTPSGGSASWSSEVTPRVEKLQDYVWRRHLVERRAAAAPHRRGRRPEASRMAVAFTDIVGYTSQSKNLTEAELVDLVEIFEDETTRAVVAVGGRVIKTIGDEVLYVADSPRAAGRGRAGAHRARRGRGRRASRGSGPASPTATVTTPARRRVRPDRQHRLAAHLRSPGPARVLVDRGAFDVLTGQDQAARHRTRRHPARQAARPGRRRARRPLAVRRARRPEVPPAAPDVGQGLPRPRAVGRPAPRQSRRRE